MPAYDIGEHIITDAVKFEEYRMKVGPMIDLDMVITLEGV